jgi:hypothetical protein
MNEKTERKRIMKSESPLQVIDALMRDSIIDNNRYPAHTQGIVLIE